MVRARPERFGAMLAIEEPPALVAIDRKLAREMGIDGGALWDGDSPGLDVDAFEDRYVTQIGVRKSLAEKPSSYDCVFFDAKTRKCRVYAARPRQCRTWPFWESNIRTPEAWAETCQACPGSGTGKLYQLKEIQNQAAVIRI